MFVGHVTGWRPIGGANGWRANVIRGTPGRAAGPIDAAVVVDKRIRRSTVKPAKRNAAIIFRISRRTVFFFRFAIEIGPYVNARPLRTVNPRFDMPKIHQVNQTRQSFLFYRGQTIVRNLSRSKSPPPPVDCFVTVFLARFSNIVIGPRPKEVD